MLVGRRVSGHGQKASEYRRRAAECRALAASMSGTDQREQLLGMAEAWEKMAEEREQLLDTSETASFAPKPRRG